MSVATMRDAALALAAEGFRVFPLPPLKKRAAMEKWQLLATTDRAQIEEWFPPPRLVPDDLISNVESNIGIATGNGLLVFDEDPRHGSEIAVANLQLQHGELPTTRTVRTPGGGRHRYYRVPADREVPNSTGKLGDGLDIKGDRGYAAAPPSATDSGTYCWESPGATISSAPEWLIALATTPRPPKGSTCDVGDTSPRETPKHGLTIDDAREILKHLTAECDEYQSWFEVIVSLRRMALGAQDGSVESDWLALADEWSRSSPKYQGRGDVEAKWLQGDAREYGYGARHLIELAKTHGWQSAGLDPNAFVPITSDPGAQPKSRFAHVPLGEFLARPEPEWIIEDVLPCATLACGYGEPGAGKSTIVGLDMTLAVARGVPWHGHDTKQCSVAYIAAESVVGLQKRLRAYETQNSLDLKTLEHQFFPMPNGPNLLKTDEVAELITYLKTLPNLGIVVIDTLAQSTPGGNENGAEDMGLAISQCKAIHEATRAIVLLIHHSGKDQARGMRGWSGILGALDTEIEVTWNKDKNRRAIWIKKQRDGESNVRLFDCVLERVTYGLDAKGREVSSVVVKQVEMEDSDEAQTAQDSDPPTSKAKKAVWDTMLAATCRISTEQLEMEAVEKIPHDPSSEKRDQRLSRVRRAIGELKAEGTLIVDGDMVSLRHSRKVAHVSMFSPVPEATTGDGSGVSA